MSEADRELIPPPPAIRAELARAVRKTQRLRSLLRLAKKAEDDRRFCDELAQDVLRREADGPGVDR